MKLSIRQFQELFKIVELELPELEMSQLIVKTLTGKSDAEIERMSVKKFNKVCKDAKTAIDAYTDNMKTKKPKKIVYVNGRLYRLHYDMIRMNAGKYVEAATFSKAPIANLHKLMATMAIPLKWTWKGLKADSVNHEDIATEMLDMDFESAYAACVFFCEVWQQSIRSMATYGSNPQEREVLDRLLSLSARYGGGYIMES